MSVYHLMRKLIYVDIFEVCHTESFGWMTMVTSTHNQCTSLSLSYIKHRLSFVDHTQNAHLRYFVGYFTYLRVFFAYALISNNIMISAYDTTTTIFYRMCSIVFEFCDCAHKYDLVIFSDDQMRKTSQDPQSTLNYVKDHDSTIKKKKKEKIIAVKRWSRRNRWLKVCCNTYEKKMKNITHSIHN